MTRLSSTVVLAAQRRRALEGTGETLPEEHGPDAARVVGGHAAREHGDALERYLAAVHREARRVGAAYIRKVGPPVAHAGAGGRELRVVGVGPADYQGVLRGGRKIAVEAKSRPSRLALAEIPQHQRDDLDEVAAMGGLALLVVELRDEQLIAAVPWREVPWAVARTAKAVTAAELRAWRVPASGFYWEHLAGGVR